MYSFEVLEGLVYNIVVVEQASTQLAVRRWCTASERAFDTFSVRVRTYRRVQLNGVYVCYVYLQQ